MKALAKHLLHCGVLTLLAVGLGEQARGVQIWASAMDGNANDLVAGNHGVATGNPIATMDRHGNPTGAVEFDGASYFQIPNTENGGSLSSLLSTEGSFALWVRIDDVEGDTGPIALGGSGTGTTQYFSLVNTGWGENPDNNIHGWRVDLDRGEGSGNRARIGAKSNGLGVDGNGYAPTGGGGVWQHLAATFELGGELRLYVNGELQDAMPALTDTTPFASTNPWVIGAERVGSRMMVGAIDDVQIFSSALSGEEIEALAHLIPGDVNNDGVANLSDFNLLRDNFGDTVYLRRLGDLNQDRVVNHLDFNLWKNSVSPALAAQASWTAVPEPSSVVLLGAGALGLVALRRKYLAWRI